MRTVAALLVGLGVASAARADAPLRALTVPLLAGEDVSADERAELTRAVERRVAERFAAADAAQLADPDRACQDAHCLARTAERLDLDAVVGGHLGHGGDGWFLTVWLYDRAKPDFLERRDETCAGCTLERAGERLGALADRVMGVERATPPRGNRWLAVAGASAAVAVVGIAVLIVEATRNGQPLCDPGLRDDGQCGELRSTTGGMVIGGALAGAAIAAGVTTLALGLRARGERNVALWAAPGAAGIVASGRW